MSANHLIPDSINCIFREKQSDYSLTVYASNNPLLEHASAILNSVENNTDGVDPSITVVKIKVLDENDNEPKFQEKVYYAGKHRRHGLLRHLLCLKKS